VICGSSARAEAKINNSGILVLGYTQALRPGVKVSWGVALDTQKLGGASSDAGAAHSVGASFTVRRPLSTSVRCRLIPFQFEG
jgi:voltage-dependent anion channel protein 2